MNERSTAEMQTSPRLTLHELTKIYPNQRRALDSLSLEIGVGVFGLLGPNGAGKSTLLQILSANLEYEQGVVLLNGRENPRRTPREWRRHISFVPQTFDFVPQLTGEEYLWQYALLANYRAPKLKEKIAELLERVHLYDARKRFAANYSRGMKQRLAIAAAFLCEPQLVLLDEPTSGLDPKERVFFRDLLAELSTSRIVILSTHIVGDIERCSDQMAVLHEGRLLFHGRPSEVSELATGRVWEIPVTPDQIPEWQASRRLVALREQNGSAIARVISFNAPSSGEPVPPRLEDGYFALLHSGTEPARAN